MVAPRLPAFDFARLPGVTPEHLQVQEAIRAFVEGEIQPNADAWDEAGTFPRELYRKAGDVGLLGLGWPAEFGGTPVDHVAKLLSSIELSRGGIGGVTASLGSHSIMLWPVIAGARDAVRREVVPQILSGEKIGALAITEPSGGSDVAQLKTRATRVAGGWSLSGSKMFITSGVRADWLLVAARTGGPGAGGVSLFLVDGGAKGLTRTPLKKIGWWASDTAALYFDEVFVPDERLVGEVDRGFRLVMQNFNGERMTMAAGGLGYAMTCVEDALDWARERRAFGQRLVDHQVVRQKLVRMIDEVLPVQAWVLQLAQRLDAGESPAGDLALAKNHAARLMRDCADGAVQILGGAGFLRGSRIERAWRDCKVYMIGGGAEEVMNDLAAKQLGLL
ncbi:MAG: acyl-CoA dehydrogenase family protein [Burkholderiales bacterium]|nr:acyl-CoA dehydrogenase family protein [Burkholderiales bacterium]MCZ8108172.1 acyl-CoA dehydrogenase family protein [Burkholderiales bacterium]